MFVKSEHYNARKEDTLNDEGQVISTYHNLRILAGMKVTKEDRRPEVAASALAVSAFAAIRSLPPLECNFTPVSYL